MSSHSLLEATFVATHRAELKMTSRNGILSRPIKTSDTGDVTMETAIVTNRELHIKRQESAVALICERGRSWQDDCKAKIKSVQKWPN